MCAFGFTLAVFFPVCLGVTHTHLCVLPSPRRPAVLRVPVFESARPCLPRDGARRRGDGADESRRSSNW